MLKLNPKQANLLSVLVALNDWEQKNSPCLQTQSSRSLYFQLAQALLAEDAQGGVRLKKRVGHASERSIRDRLRTFQEAGLLLEHSGSQDARTRQIVPTDKFTVELCEHLDHYIELLEDRYLLIEN